MSKLTNVVCDIESYYDSKVSLTKLSTAQYVHHPLFKIWGLSIKIEDGDTQWYGEDEVDYAINSIDWANTNLICQNVLFDGYVLKELYGVKPAWYTDTAAMGRGLEPGQSARLKDLCERYFPDDPTMRKGEELSSAKGHYDLDPELEEAIAGYCDQDVDLTYALDQVMRPLMPTDELLLIHKTSDMFCNPTLRLDKELTQKTHDDEIKQKTELFAKLGVDKKTLSSNLKFVELVESMDIVPPMKRSLTTGKMIPAFAKKDAGFLQLQAMYPQHADLWRARGLAKSSLEETRALRFTESVNNDGTFSVPLKYYAAHTGRFGGSDKLNLQNMPRESPLRRALISPANHYVYVADLSAIEARMLAWLAGEHELLDEFRRDEDVYSNFAGDSIYNMPDPRSGLRHGR